MNLKIMVIDDHQLFLEGLIGILQGFDFVEKVFFENDVNKIHESVMLKDPHLILLDINLNGSNGLEIGKMLKEKKPLLKIIIISMHNHPALIQQAQSLGFDAYLSKDVSTQSLKSAIKLIMEDKIWDWGMILNQNSENKFLRNNFNLSSRELQVVGLLAKGYDNEQISKELVLSYHTVKTHRKNIYMKLDISSVSQLILFAKKHLI
jgi:DNA-binding NarL/FixJ family response regulator